VQLVENHVSQRDASPTGIAPGNLPEIHNFRRAVYAIRLKP